jgi:hypothetical protein
MTITKSRRNNIIFLVVIALLIIPQTRQPIQILLHKGYLGLRLLMKTTGKHLLIIIGNLPILTIIPWILIT